MSALGGRQGTMPINNQKEVFLSYYIFCQSRLISMYNKLGKHTVQQML